MRQLPEGRLEVGVGQTPFGVRGGWRGVHVDPRGD